MTTVIQQHKICGHNESRAKREIYCNTSLPQERKTIPNEQSKLTINETRKGRTYEAQSQ